MFSMEAFADEMLKIAAEKHALAEPLLGAGRATKEFIRAHPRAPALGLAAVGGGAALKGGERLWENQLMAEAMRDRMAAAREA